MKLAEELAKKYKGFTTSVPEGDGWSWEDVVKPEFVAAVNDVIERCARVADFEADLHKGCAYERIGRLEEDVRDGKRDVSLEIAESIRRLREGK